MNLKQKLIEIRKQVAYLQKDAKAYNYKYVKEDAILFAIKDKMDELGVLLEPHVRNHDLKEFSYLTKSGNTVTESIVKGDMVFVWVDADSDETREINWALYGQKQDASQALGSGLTYCNRYFLLKYFQIATSEDDPDKLRSKQLEKEDKEYAQSMARLKSNLPDKLKLEAKGNEDLARTGITATLEHFGVANWKALNLSEIPEKAFIAKFIELIKEVK